MQDHEVVLGNDSLKVERRFRRLGEEAADQGREDFWAVGGGRVVLGVGRAEIPLSRLRSLALDEGQVEEVEDDSLGVRYVVGARGGPFRFQVV